MVRVLVPKCARWAFFAMFCNHISESTGSKSTEIFSAIFEFAQDIEAKVQFAIIRYGVVKMLIRIFGRDQTTKTRCNKATVPKSVRRFLQKKSS